MGGYFAGLLDRSVLDTTLDHETFRGLGSGLGCGAVTILTDDCPVAVAASVLAYFDRENAGQWGLCFNGTAAMAAAAGALRDGVASAEDVARVDRWSVVLRGRGACATLDGAANVRPACSNTSHSSSRSTSPASADSAEAVRCAHSVRTRWRQRPNHEQEQAHPARPDDLRRLRRLRQARAGVLLSGRLGIRSTHR